MGRARPGHAATLDRRPARHCADRDGARRLLVDGEPVTPADLQVRSVVAADRGGVVFIANPIDDATVSHVWRYDDEGLAALTDEPGVHTASAAGGTVVIRTTTLDEPRAFWDTLDGVELSSAAATPNLALNASLHFLGSRRLATTVILPNDHDGRPLPVLLDPYGGPHALRSLRSHLPHLVSQWFADHGFAVVVVDGRGTPGRGSEWERAIHGDLATTPLEDQIDALEQAAAELGCLDLDRVAIRGWSFGGYLAALAVLLRPDRIHAAVAGAPVTEWRLYDTHYTERYLGDPTVQPEVYDGSSLLPLAGELSRPLLLIHGLADDNVFAAHTLQLSSRLLAAGRAHEVLPLVGVTHMTPQEVVAENLLAAPARLPSPRPQRSRRTNVAGVEDRLKELYRGVAVHATADREHMAALELLALVMLADSHLGDDELDVLRELTEDWRGKAFSFEQYLGPAVAKARQAFRDETVTEFLDDVDSRITVADPAQGAVLGRPPDHRRRRQRQQRRERPPRRHRRSLRLTAFRATTGGCRSSSKQRRLCRRRRLPLVDRQPDRPAGARSSLGTPRTRPVRQRATATRSRPARSGRISTASKAAATSRSATAEPWSAPISRTSQPPGRIHCGASPTIIRTASSPSGPANRATCRLPRPHGRFDVGRVVGDVGRVGDSEIELRSRPAGRRTTTRWRCARCGRGDRGRRGWRGRRRWRRRWRRSSTR